jgi:hypothetical protein
MDGAHGSDGGAGGGESSLTFPHGVTSMSVERTIVSNVSFLGVFHKTPRYTNKPTRPRLLHRKCISIAELYQPVSQSALALRWARPAN